MYEVGHVCRNILTTLSDAERREIEVYNENFFRDLSAYSLSWTLLRDGNPVRSGNVADIAVAPRQSEKICIPWGDISGDGEWLLNEIGRAHV